MDQTTGQDTSPQAALVAACWRAACRKAVFLLRADVATAQTGGDPWYAWRVMDLARQLMPQQREG